MNGDLHGGLFDGTKFDMREWDSVPSFIYASSYPSGKSGVHLSRDENAHGVKYVLDASVGDLYHYVMTGLDTSPLFKMLSN